MRRARPLLGTIVEIEVRGLGKEAGARAVDAAFAQVAEVRRRMSFHDPASMLSRLNRRAKSEAVVVDEWTFEVLEMAAELHTISRGVFDITIAPRLQALGFLPRAKDAEGNAFEDGPEFPLATDEHGPTRMQRNAASRNPCSIRAHPWLNFSPLQHFRDTRRESTFAEVELLSGRRVRFLHDGVCIDLGGIAKGFAVDRAIAALRAAGASAALVNAGGDLRAFGDATFLVAIRHPDAPGATLGTVALHEAALATSAHYFADRVVAGSAAGPIIDPRSQAQVRAIRSATVRAPSAMLADALTKIAMISGEAALPVLAHYGADAILVATGGEAVCSAGLHAAFEFPS